MLEIDHLVLLAEYNKLMNQRQIEAVGKLSTAEISEDKGAFFKSILGTLNHILVGDIIWLQRFSEHPSSSEVLAYTNELEKPKSLESIIYKDFEALREEREKVDRIIIEWVSKLSENDLGSCLKYRNMAGATFSKPFYSLINHLFLHQVHHRGQVTTLLSQSNVDFGETDLIEIISDCNE